MQQKIVHHIIKGFENFKGLDIDFEAFKAKAAARTRDASDPKPKAD